MDSRGHPFKVTKIATDLTPRKDENRKLADEFEANVKSLVGVVASSARDLSNTAGGLSNAASETNGKASVVAAASEELSASVGEIESQVGESGRITEQAVRDAAEIGASREHVGRRGREDR